MRRKRKVNEVPEKKRGPIREKKPGREAEERLKEARSYSSYPRNRTRGGMLRRKRRKGTIRKSLNTRGRREKRDLREKVRGHGCWI